MSQVTFHDVSPATFEKLAEHITGLLEGQIAAEGTVDVQGVRCSYDYNKSRKTLSVRVIQVPSVITQGYVIGWLCDALRRNAVKTPSKPKRSK